MVVSVIRLMRTSMILLFRVLRKPKINIWCYIFTAGISYLPIVHMCVSTVPVKEIKAVWAAPVSNYLVLWRIAILDFVRVTDVVWGSCTYFCMFKCVCTTTFQGYRTSSGIVSRWNWFFLRKSYPLREYQDLELNSLVVSYQWVYILYPVIGISCCL